ncbi:MAG: B12-binding domain-containing radical SAM protein [Saccharofermentanales bacterium]
MKIALISCNSERQGFPPMGIMYLSSYIKQSMQSIEVKMYDLIPEIETLINEGFSLIGLSCLTIQYYQTEQYAKALRERYKGIICIGGIHVTLTCELPSWADVAVIGEGEQTFVELLQCLNNNNLQISTALNTIDGIIFRYQNIEKKTKDRKLIENIDCIPYPDREAIGIEKYLIPNNIYGTVVGRGLTIMTSRGCPYSCEFCSSSKMWGNIRFNSAEYVVKEIELLINNYKIEHIWVADDHFGVNARRLSEIALYMEKNNVKINLGINGRIESYDDNMAALYKRVGVKAIAFGLETGSEILLKKIKNNSTKSVEEAITIVKKAASDGFEIHGMFMINLPDETMEDIKSTIHMIHTLPLSKCSVAIATPYIGTKWWDIAVSQGIVPEKPDSMFWNTYNIKEYVDDRPLFINGIKKEDLLDIYGSIQEYQKKLFFFDWNNRK